MFKRYGFLGFLARRRQDRRESSGGCAVCSIEPGISVLQKFEKSLATAKVTRSSEDTGPSGRIPEYVYRSSVFLLLCISLGVGVVLRASDGRSIQLVDKSTGWDSFGIVSSKKDIVTMIMKFRS